MGSRLPLVVAFACLATSAFAVKFKLVNNCKFTVWPGILGPEPIPEQGGFELKAGASKDVEVPNGWRSNRIWPRTGCDAKMNCETGSCGPKLKCAGAGGEPPVSLAEFTLASNSNEKDFYDVSYVDGYNVEMTVEPIEGTFKKEGGDKYSCTQAGKCTGGDPLKAAPEELKQKKDGKVVAVYTACTKERLDSYCCAGAHNVPAKCDPKKDWPKDLYSPLKKLCPSGYWYAYDDATSTFTCKGNKNPSPDYKITFCGESSSQSPSPDATTAASATTPKEVESGPCTETCSNGGHTPTCCQAHNFKTGSCRDGKAFCVPKE